LKDTDSQLRELSFLRCWIVLCERSSIFVSKRSISKLQMLPGGKKGKKAKAVVTRRKVKGRRGSDAASCRNKRAVWVGERGKEPSSVQVLQGAMSGDGNTRQAHPFNQGIKVLGKEKNL
jgi:hypothetical protein